MAEIYFLEFDDENSEHLAQHGLSRREVRQMLGNLHLTVKNPGHADRELLIGETNGGRVLTVAVEATRDPGTWRPITGWDATPAELKVWAKHSR